MKVTLMALGLAMAGGCAHGSGTQNVATELRGEARVAETARVLVAGPAGTVHASVDGPRAVSLFLVDRVHGDDRDCGDATYAQKVSGSAHLDVGAKQELCAVAERGQHGPSFIMWHAHLGERGTLWALQ